MKPKILYYDCLNFSDKAIAFLNDNFTVISIKDPRYDNNRVLETLDCIFAPLGFQTDKNKIERCKNLKVILSNTTGHPHIDYQFAVDRNIKVACLKYEQEFLDTITPTAEHTIGLMIALTRKYKQAIDYVEQGRWSRQPFAGERMLSRTTVGIVGMGRLGKKVARVLRAFDAEVMYYDPHVNNSDIPGVAKVEFEVLLNSSDIISLHLHHTPATEKFISRQEIGLMKKGAFLVNTSRGELLDWSALIDALKCEHLAGAAMDVIENEFTPQFDMKQSAIEVYNYINKYSNLIITPHIGGSTKDAWEMTQLKTIEIALKYLNEEGLF